MGGRYGGSIEGKRRNRNGPSSGQVRRDWTQTLGRLLTIHDCPKCGSKTHIDHPTPPLPLEKPNHDAQPTS